MVTFALAMAFPVSFGITCLQASSNCGYHVIHLWGELDDIIDRTWYKLRGLLNYAKEVCLLCI